MITSHCMRFIVVSHHPGIAEIKVLNVLFWRRLYTTLAPLSKGVCSRLSIPNPLETVHADTISASAPQYTEVTSLVL